MKLLAIGFIEAVLLLTGAGTAEELDGEVLEKFEYYLAHPLKINEVSRSKLLSSGLFSSYQVATLTDYGKVMSVMELGLVDGFSPQVAEALSLFLDFDGDIGERSRWSMISATAKADLKAAAGRLKYSFGDYADAAAAFKTPYETPGKTTWTAYVSASKGNVTVVAGDYNLRYAQGLALWTGFSLTTLSSLDAFSKRGTGIAPSWSYTGEGTLRGAAVELTLGRLRLSGFSSAKDGFLSGANANYLFPGAELDLTVTMTRMSMGTRASIRRVDIFAEAVWDWERRSYAATAGTAFKTGPLKWALRGRMVPSAYSGKRNGEYSAAMGMNHHCRVSDALLTVDGQLLPVPVKDPSRRKLKILGQWSFQTGESFGWTLREVTTLTSYDLPHRSDLRLDLKYARGPYTAVLRSNLVWGKGFGRLFYLDLGRKTQVWSLFLRGTYFHADNWSDRLYSYERDAPGNFLVPAYYKQGFSASALCSLTLRLRKIRLKFYLRGSGTFYAKKQKPDAWALRFQISID